MRRLLHLLVGLAMLPCARPALASPATPPSLAAGERLDGREDADSGHLTLKVVPRTLLFLPRVLFSAVMLPTAWVAEKTEAHHLYRRLYWTVTSDDELSGLRPEVVFESSSVFMAGLRYFNRRMLGEDSRFMVRARAGGLHSMFGELAIEVRGLSFIVDGERRDSATFAGTTGQTKDELADEGLAVTRFGYDRAATLLAFEQPLGPLLSIEPSVGVALWTFNNGTSRGGDPTINTVYCGDCAMDVVSDAQAPGFNDGTREVRAGVALLTDTRGHARYGSGVAGRITGDWAHGIAGDPSHDIGASADLVGSYDFGERALGLRLHAAVIEPLGSDPVPFIALAGASGRNGIRALRTGRLRGNSAFVATAFYRYMLTPNIDFMLFADYGGAFGSWFQGFNADHLIDGYGASLWLYGTEGHYDEGDYLARVEGAWAPGEGYRIVLVTKHDWFSGTHRVEP